MVLAFVSLSLGFILGSFLIYLLFFYTETESSRNTTSIFKNPAPFWNQNEKQWEVSRYKDIKNILKQPNVLSANFLPSLFDSLSSQTENDVESDFKILKDFFQNWMLFKDGKQHLAVRSHFQKFLTEENVSNLTKDIEKVIEELLDNLELNWKKIQKEVEEESDPDEKREKSKKGIDLVKEFCFPLPLNVVTKIIGFPKCDTNKFKEWSDIVEEWFGGVDKEEKGEDEEGKLVKKIGMYQRFENCQNTILQYHQYFNSLIALYEKKFSLKLSPNSLSSTGFEENRIEDENIQENTILFLLLKQISNLDQNEQNEKNITFEEIRDNLFFLMAAGHETVTCLLSHTLVLYFDHSTYDLYDIFNRSLTRFNQSNQGDPWKLYPYLFSELIRIVSPIKRLTRRFLKTYVRPPPTSDDPDTIPEDESDLCDRPSYGSMGQLVQLNVTKGNLDPEIYKDPHQLKASRFETLEKSKSHLSFGFGSHVCPGLKLAEVETKIGINKLIKRFPKMNIIRSISGTSISSLESINSITSLYVHLDRNLSH